MEVDSPTSTLSLFDLSRANFPFSEPVVHSIETRRAALADVLIFDILLSSRGINNPDTLYPPSDADALARLLDAIENSTYDRLKRDCLVYYLLKWHTADDRRSREVAFITDRCIPPQLVMLADAYWALDTGTNVERAVSLLSDARLNGDYTSKILQALALSSETGTPTHIPRTRIPHIPKRAALILRYVRTSKPLLVEPDDLDVYTIALAEASGIASAWSFQRTFPEQSDTRSRLIKLIVDWSLAPTPRPAPLRAFLGLPFTPYERTLVNLHATNPPSYLTSAAVTALRDATLIRLLHSGAHASALRLTRAFATTTHAPASSYAGAARAPPGPREDDKAIRRRQELVEEIRSVMPAAERALLDAEFDAPLVTSSISRPNGIPSASKSKKPIQGDLSMSTVSTVPADLSTSWEEIRLPLSGRRSAVDPPIGRPISEIAGAPRFGLGNGTISVRDTFPVPVSTSISARISASVGPLSTKSRAIESGQANGTGSQSISAGPRMSIYDTTGSARSARNAFYEPPISSPLAISAQRAAPRGLGESTTEVAAILEDPTDMNATMLIEDVDRGMDIDHTHPPSRAAAGAGSDHEEPDAQEGFGFSVFSSQVLAPAPEASAPESEPISGRSGLRRTKTGTMLPPGAFVSTPTPEPQSVLADLVPKEEEEEEEASASMVRYTRSGNAKVSSAKTASSAKSASATKSDSVVKSASVAKSASAAGTSSASTRSQTSISSRARKEETESLSRSLPGTLIMGSDEEEDEPEPEPEARDEVPPMRGPSARTTRAVKRRTSSGTIHSEDEDDAAHAPVPATPRRSARLSHPPPDLAPVEETKKKKSRTTATKTPRKR